MTARLLLRPQVLRDVTTVETSTEILGRRYDFPVAVAPSAYQKLVGGKGEVDVARASHKTGTNFTLSSNATTSMEDVAQALPPRDESYPKPWFQLYCHANRDVTKGLVERAERAGYDALVLTVDTPITGNRLHDRKSPLKLPSHLSMANFSHIKVGLPSRGRLLLNARNAKEAKKIAAENHLALNDRSLTWENTIPWLRSQTKLKIIVKGILTAEDALRAVDSGVDALIVSNHGGRQLDGAPATLEVLPEVVEAVQGRIPVIIDGGITRGSDVFKALALGADLCLIGRTALWGLAWDGENGVEAVLNILERELWRTMTLMGARSIKEISSGMLGRSRRDGFGVAKL